MTVTITSLTPVFAGEVGAIDLRKVHDRSSLEAIRAGMDTYAVLVFRDQDFTNEEQLDFAQRFDGTLHARTSSSAIGSNRFGNEALADVSNVDRDGKIRDANNRMRASSVANRLWHTDASFVDPPGRYSMLSARVVPPVRADTDFADMRAAYDALDAETRASIEGLRVYHSIVYSRHVLGFDDAMSRDHDWGPRLQIFLGAPDFADHAQAIVAAFAPRDEEIATATEILLAAQSAQWGPTRHHDTLHDRASYRYYWSVLRRAQTTGRAVPQDAAPLFVKVGTNGQSAS